MKINKNEREQNDIRLYECVSIIMCVSLGVPVCMRYINQVKLTIYMDTDTNVYIIMVVCRLQITCFKQQKQTFLVVLLVQLADTSR